MKIVLMTSVMVLLASAGHAAGVSDFGAMVQRHTPSCGVGAPGISRTAFLPGLASPCCDGRVQCSQMLATTKIDRPRGLSHT